jgi:ribose 5-phosphate isomerase B
VPVDHPPFIGKKVFVNNIDEAEIQLIVKRVVDQVMGLSNQSSLSPQPAPAQKMDSLSVSRKIVAIGADHGGFELKEILKPELASLGFEVVDVGTMSKEPVDYPDFAHEVALQVSSGKAWRGIMIDGAGIGSCIVANKVPGVRAGMAYDYSSAVNSREHNDTNVLTLGAGLIGVNLAKQIVKIWLATEFGGGRHTGRVAKITAVEKKYIK